MKGEAGKFWNAYVPKLVDAGIATSLDTPELTAMSEWWADYRDCQENEHERIRGLTLLAESIHALANVIDEHGVSAEYLSAAAESIGDVIVKLKYGSLQTQRKRAYDEFSKVSARFGMAPQDRQKLTETGEAKKADDPFETFLRRRLEAGNVGQG